MKAAEIISEIKGLTPEGYAEVSAFILQTERADPALQAALARKRAPAVAETTSLPYAASRAQALAALRPPE